MTLRSAKSGSGYSLWGWHKCRNRSDCRANSLDALGVIGGTDKSSVAHDYLRHYDRILPNTAMNLSISSRSCFLTRHYTYGKNTFAPRPSSGIDIRPQNKLYEQGRMIVEIGSQDDPEHLATYVPDIRRPLSSTIVRTGLIMSCSHSSVRSRCCCHTASMSSKTCSFMLDRLSSRISGSRQFHQLTTLPSLY